MSRILLIGIPGAGKSTLAARLNRPVIALDNIRVGVSDGTPAGDYLARSHFLRACQEQSNAVFEFNGAGSHRHPVRLALLLLNEPLLTVYVRVSVSVSIARTTLRGTTVPFPTYGVDPAQALPEMIEVLESDFANGFWSSKPGWTAVALDGTRPTDELLAAVEGA
jgi:hypothetical protein